MNAEPADGYMTLPWATPTAVSLPEHHLKNWAITGYAQDAVWELNTLMKLKNESTLTTTPVKIFTGVVMLVGTHKRRWC